ncbi:MAG: TPP-dependent pyruvate/acetoin dehydrogenase alpha subunit [Candidatus Omnitrophota bacterium]|jgi:TPP-dependent pyruvate/acetoin dehydrogenase alpha subunit
MLEAEVESQQKNLTAETFALIFGEELSSLSKACLNKINTLDFGYQSLSQSERDGVMQRIMLDLEKPMSFSGAARHLAWETGWDENYKEYISSNYDLEKLIPKYYRRGRSAMRVLGDFILPNSDGFETNVLAVLTQWLADTLLKDADNIYEFGCGPGHNLVALSQIFPDKKFVGLDWANSSQKILQQMATSQNMSLEAHNFDFFLPDYRIKMRPNSHLLTFGALEQVGGNYKAFLNYVLHQAPDLCINVEPILELYDQSNLMDHLAHRYSKKRGYLNGYLSALRLLREQGLVEILLEKRTVGSMYHEGWTIIAWKPIRKTKGQNTIADYENEKQDALDIYEDVFKIRTCEELIRREYPNDLIKTPVHLSHGQEGIVAGVLHALPQDTDVYGTYRSHGIYISKTKDMDGFFAEMYGKVTGGAKGKSGSMHLSKPKSQLIFTSAVVATTIPLAAGTAFRHQYKDSETLVAVFFGDGAVEEGVFWETINFACLKKLRILFICEDNGLAIHTPNTERRGYKSMQEALSGFDILLGSANGCDPKSVLDSTRTLLEQMNAENRPGFLHATYHRQLQHVGIHEDYDYGYRDKPSDEQYAKLDPVIRALNWVRSLGVGEDALERIRDQVLAQAEVSIKKASQDDFPDTKELLTDVYS